MLFSVTFSDVAAVKQEAIVVRDVYKKYRLYRRQSDRLVELLTGRARHQTFWALNGVSFTIDRGEIAGIIGRNGAGKTTLLRLLTGISRPTHGEIDIHQRMSAILELGSGFHPEFTGRENVFLGGAVLGMSEATIWRKYDEIVAFAELGPYMDMPFKTYSLGMQARLSFSVAISVEPEILIIDEALAAGDGAFIAKCFERIQEICASGATVLFVSHNTYLVQRLCRRALWINHGQLEADGDPAIVCRDYETALRAHETAQRAEQRAAEQRRFSDGPMRAGPASGTTGVAHPAPAATRRGVRGTGEATLLAVELRDARGGPVETVFTGDPLTVHIEYEADAPYDDLVVVVLITRADGVAACGLDSREAGLHLPALHGRGSFDVTLDPVLLGRGRYFVSPHIYRDRHGVPGQDDVLVYHDRLYEFYVERRGRPYDVAVEQPARWRHHMDGTPVQPPDPSPVAP